jgi:hypothetical protein
MTRLETERLMLRPWLKRMQKIFIAMQATLILGQ